MTNPLPPPTVDEHHSGPGPGQINTYSDSSMVTVSSSLGVPNNTVVSMATMTQPMNQMTNQQGPRPAYSPSYRGRPRGRRPVGASTIRPAGGGAPAGAAGVAGGAPAGWNSGGGVAEKRTAAAAGMNNTNVRRPYRGNYVGSWPNRSPTKSSPTGAHQGVVQGNNSQGMMPSNWPQQEND